MVLCKPLSIGKIYLLVDLLESFWHYDIWHFFKLITIDRISARLQKKISDLVWHLTFPNAELPDADSAFMYSNTPREEGGLGGGRPTWKASG